MPLFRQPNVAIVLSSFHPGGTEYQTTELVARMPRDRWRVHVACFHREGAWLSRVADLASPVAEFPISSFKHGSTLSQMKRFAAWCRTLDLDVVHTCDLYANIFALPAAAWAHVPVRIGSRRELNPDKSLGLIALQRGAYGCAHWILANSRAAAARLRQEGVPARRIAVVPNGLDLSRFADTAPRNDGLTLIVVGNLRPEKGHATLLEAAARVLPHHPALRVQCVGDGPARARLSELAERLGISCAVEFLGHREDVPALLRAASIAVVPSLSEAFPNAALEAMAAGLPVIASATGGLLELVEDGSTGLLVPPGNPAGLADAIDRLLADPQLRRRFGTAGRERVEGQYSFERMVSAVESLYGNELSRRSVATPARVAVS